MLSLRCVSDVWVPLSTVVLCTPYSTLYTGAQLSVRPAPRTRYPPDRATSDYEPSSDHASDPLKKSILVQLLSTAACRLYKLHGMLHPLTSPAPLSSFTPAQTTTTRCYRTSENDRANPPPTHRLDLTCDESLARRVRDALAASCCVSLCAGVG